MSNDIYMQPITSITEGHAFERLGFHAYSEYRKTIMFKDTLTKLEFVLYTCDFFYRCLPCQVVQQSKSKKPTTTEDLALISYIGHSVTAVIETITHMIEELTGDSPLEHVERLLSFYWDYLCNVNGIFKSILFNYFFSYIGFEQKR